MIIQSDIKYLLYIRLFVKFNNNVIFTNNFIKFYLWIDAMIVSFKIVHICKFIQNLNAYTHVFGSNTSKERS